MGGSMIPYRKSGKMKTEGRSDRLSKTIQKHSRIPASALNPNRYTETLMTAAYEAGIYDDALIGAVQGNLFDLLSQRLEAMTGGESCSVSAETAQAVLSAMLYTIDLRLYDESTPDDAAQLLAVCTAVSLFDDGVQKIKRRLAASELLWRKHLPLYSTCQRQSRADSFPDSQFHALVAQILRRCQSIRCAYRNCQCRRKSSHRGGYPFWSADGAIKAQRSGGRRR